MSQSYTLIVFSTIYTVLAMILVSLDGTYNITNSLFGNFVGNDNYGTGISLNSKGFYIHIIIFSLLIVLPMLMCKSDTL